MNTNEMKTKYCDTQDVINALLDDGKLVRITPATGNIIRYSVYDGNGYIGHSAGVVYWYLQKHNRLRRVGEPQKDAAGNTCETYKYVIDGTAKRISKWLDK